MRIKKIIGFTINFFDRIYSIVIINRISSDHIFYFMKSMMKSFQYPYKIAWFPTSIAFDNVAIEALLEIYHSINNWQQHHSHCRQQ